MSSEGRIPWKESNLALIGSDLDHKIKQAAAEGEEQWKTLGLEPGLRIWRIEQFQVKEWPKDQYGEFYKGDSYIVMHSYKKEDSDALAYDVHIWIGSNSSQDEYGTAAYKMVEADDSVEGSAIQHREVEGHESPLFQSYFPNGMRYLDGGAATGFNIVKATTEQPHLYKVKGTEKAMSLTQMPLSKSSLNAGDSFFLFQNPGNVWVWHGSGANPDEKAKCSRQAEIICKGGTVKTLDQTEGDDDPEFWAFLGDGEIAPAEEGDELVESFCPLLFKLSDDPDVGPEQIAKAEQETKHRWGPPVSKLPKSLLEEGNVYLLDAGWELYLWMGASASKAEKLAGMSKADAYAKEDPRTMDLPLTIVKSGMEHYCPDFQAFFN